MVRKLRFAALVILGVVQLGAGSPSSTLHGYTPAGGESERQAERQFIDIPSAQNALDTLTAVAARPHEAGSPADYALAVDMRDRMRADGIAASLEALTARVDSPRKLLLELAPPADIAAVGNAESGRHHRAFPLRLNLSEPLLGADRAASSRGVGLPFNAGSADGDVSAPLVYAGHGLAADYAALAGAGVDVRGAVVLVRYGAQFRGTLALRAQASGAAAIIFYSDPADDGPARGRPYPDGPGDPLTAVARGWVGPGVRIPTLPISALNAKLLLGSLDGIPGPPGWAGALPVAYPLARGPGRVHLVVKLARRQMTLWNTIGIIPGLHGDENITLAAQRDAWVYGAADNGAGVTTVLEVARGLGFLLQSGWRPERTIILAGWDGEANGFAGSQAYARLHRLDTARGCFAYLSADQTVTGALFSVRAAPALTPLFYDAARAVPDPQSPGASVYARWSLQRHATTPDDPWDGSGDHAALAAQRGTPVGVLRFAGPFGVDRSASDTVAYVRRWSDPDASFERAAAQLYGIITLRLADAAVVPYVFSGYIGPLRGSLAQLLDQANRAGLRVDATPVRSAIDRLAPIAARFDRSVPPRDDDVERSPRELRAARALDSIVYDASGDARPLFPDADTALADHDAPAVDAALGHAADAIDEAARALTL